MQQGPPARCLATARSDCKGPDETGALQGGASILRITETVPKQSIISTKMLAAGSNVQLSQVYILIPAGVPIMRRFWFFLDLRYCNFSHHGVIVELEISNFPPLMSYQ